MSEGIALLAEGAAALSESTQRDDVRAMEQAGAKIGQGLSQLENGLAARRALEGGEPPPQVALEWFKTQLNLLPAQIDSKDTRILWMTPFHLFLCTLLLAATGVSLTVYVLRMRRASHLIERIVAGSTGEGGAPATAAERRSNAATTPSSTPTEAPEGLLPLQRKKLCRLRVARIYPETPDVKTFRFVCCDRGPIPFSYLPGQFLTLTLPIEGNNPINADISAARVEGKPGIGTLQGPVANESLEVRRLAEAHLAQRDQHRTGEVLVEL